MRRPRPVLALLLLAMTDPVPAGAQSPAPAPLVTDRPDFTESAAVVGDGRVQLEAGYTFANSDGTDTHEIGEALVRIGVGPVFEVRVQVPSWVDVETEGAGAEGASNAAVGGKLVLREGERSAVALLAGTSVPVGSDDVAVDAWEPDAALALAWEPGERWGLGSNVGWTWTSDGDRRAHQGHASVALGVALTERVGAFVETYGFVHSRHGGEALHADAGLTVLSSPDLQFDARVGTGVAGPTGDWFAGVGFSRRW